MKRVYETAEDRDGFRVLVDRLWPRGVSKDKARVDLWLKDVSPSDALRRAVHGETRTWEEFVAAYAKELEAPRAQAAIAALKDRLKEGAVTLLYAARDEARNNAVALKQLLESGN